MTPAKTRDGGESSPQALQVIGASERAGNPRGADHFQCLICHEVTGELCEVRTVSLCSCPNQMPLMARSMRDQRTASPSAPLELVDTLKD